MSRDEAFTRMAGKSGTVVQLSIRRGAKRLRVGVTRELLTARTVSATMVTESGTQFGYLALSQFGKDSAQDVRNALVDMQKSNAEGIVLDLRNNPGGLVPAGREIGGLFLSGKQVLYHSIDRTGTARDVESSGAPLMSKPLVIIVNGATTSAAEMLAAALQDNHRAMLSGGRTARPCRARPRRSRYGRESRARPGGRPTACGPDIRRCGLPAPGPQPQGRCGNRSLRRVKWTIRAGPRRDGIGNIAKQWTC